MTNCTKQAMTRSSKESEPMRRAVTYLAFLAIMSSTFVTVLNTSMTRIASPDFVRVFGLDYSQLTWVYNSYQIVYAILLPVFGLLGDKYGRRRFLLGGLAVVGLGSLMSGLAWDYASLVTFRLIQGVGASAIFPNAVVLALGLFPPEHRGKVMGVWGMAVSLGSVTGPTIGGLIINYLGWKYLFFANLPLVLIALVSIGFSIKSDSKKGASFRFDFTGMTLLSIMLVTLVLSLQTGSDDGWLAASTLVQFAVVVLSTALFLKAEAKAEEPLIDMDLVTSKTFLSGLYCGGMHLVAIQGTQFLMPLFMAAILGLDALQIGLLMVPQAAIRLVASPMAGMLEDRYGCRVPVTAGIVVRTASLLSLALLTPQSSRTLITLGLMLDGAGAALIWSPSMNSVLCSTPPEKASSVTGIFNMVRFIMATVGVVLVGIVLDHFQGRAGGAAVTNKPVPGYFQSYLVLALLTSAGLLLLRWMEQGGARGLKAKETLEKETEEKKQEAVSTNS